MSPTSILPLKTRPFRPPLDDFERAIKDHAAPLLREKDVLVVASKVVSISQGRCVPIGGALEKSALIEREADFFVPASQSAYDIYLTIKGGTLIASAGIDESNGNGFYILWPARPDAWAEKVCAGLMKSTGIRDLGVIVADSHSIPLRWGVVGISIGHFGICTTVDYRGALDIFGARMQTTQANIPDAIAAAAVGVMGEGDECTPMVIVRDWPRLRFTTSPSYATSRIAPKDDIYWPLLRALTER